MIRPGLVSITFRKLEPREIVSLVRQAGLDAIEWGGDLHVPHGHLARAATVARMTVEAGLRVSAYGSYYRVGTSEQQDLPFAAVLETAVKLGAPIIRVWAGVVGSAQATAADRRRLVQDAQRIAGLAAAAPVTIAFEFHGGTLTDTATAARQLLEEVDQPGVRTFWQPPVGADADACLAGLTGLLPWLTNLHVFHWGPTAAVRHPLAAGADRWKRYLAAVGATGRDHFASIEYVCDDTPQAFLRDAEVLRGWLAET